jgi:acyl-CoA dehydrogenase
MDFEPSPRAREWLRRLQEFLDRFVLPHNAAWHREAAAGRHAGFVSELQVLAREEGLWNLCLPGLPPEAPGTRLANLDYAPLAEAMGRLPWSAEVFNCNAPDSGNMELLLRHGSPMQQERWLMPLLEARIRSAFAMTEPDVASSDPTNLQAHVRREAGALVISGRKWFVTGAAHPDCRLLVVVCRNAGAAEADPHDSHSLILVPADAPGVEMVRNIPVLQHAAPEGHCELVFRQVRVPEANLLGGWGEGFALAQARLGPGRVHHCMRTIGQCELALALACDRALERCAFGKPLAQQANVQDWIAESRLEIEQARLLVLRVAWALDQREPPAGLRESVAAIKVVAARLQTRVSIARFRCSGRWDSPRTRRWHHCSRGAARCGSWMDRTRCTCAASRGRSCGARRSSVASGRTTSRPRSSCRRPCAFVRPVCSVRGLLVRG